MWPVCAVLFTTSCRKSGPEMKEIALYGTYEGTNIWWYLQLDSSLFPVMHPGPTGPNVIQLLSRPFHVATTLVPCVFRRQMRNQTSKADEGQWDLYGGRRNNEPLRSRRTGHVRRILLYAGRGRRELKNNIWAAAWRPC